MGSYVPVKEMSVNDILNNTIIVTHYYALILLSSFGDL